MSVLVDALATQAARYVPNPDRSRITSGDWLEFYNSVARDIGARLFAIRRIAVFDIQADTDYDYPDDMTRLVKLWVTDTPTDVDSYREVREIREDQFVDMVNMRYPTGTLPERYLPTPSFFRVVPRPTALIEGAGKIEYWGLPDEVATIVGTYMQQPDLMREWVVEGMVIHALRALKQIAEANDRYAAWGAREDFYRTSLTDRADDRRPALVPRSAKRGTLGMV